MHRVVFRMSATLMTIQIILPGTLRPGILYCPSQCRSSRGLVRPENLHQGTNFSRCLGLVYMGWGPRDSVKHGLTVFPFSCRELPFRFEDRAATDPAGRVPIAVGYNRLFQVLD